MCDHVNMKYSTYQDNDWRGHFWRKMFECEDCGRVGTGEKHYYDGRGYKLEHEKEIGHYRGPEVVEVEVS